MKIQTGIPKTSGWYWFEGLNGPCYVDKKYKTISNDSYPPQRGWEEGYYGYRWVGPIENPFKDKK